MDGHQLRAHFIKFNEQYFAGRLPTYKIRVVEKIPSPRESMFGTWGRCLKKKGLIEILREQSDEETISTLLHEMAHRPRKMVTGSRGGKR